MESYPKNISASLENSRNCLRRIARNDDTEFSHQSVLNLIEQFVKTVNAMDDTILVPCRLMDLKVGDAREPVTAAAVAAVAAAAQPEKKQKKKPPHPAHELLHAADLFEVYSLLNGMKSGLLWGHGREAEAEADAEAGAVTAAVSLTASGGEPEAPKGHVRRSSTVSVASTGSTASIGSSGSAVSAGSAASTGSATLSDSESDAGTEADSGVEEGEEFAAATELVAQRFRKHLLGLTRSLRQMTEVAGYLTERYQHDIGGGAV